uniref:Ig-like domain-containing protein n=1 Tax=Lutzomyia longipalpis TaxID=7200 RepID=A0A1B0CT59_LUTLO
MEREFLDPEMGNHTTVGSLIINAARKRDSGNYTCSPSNSEAITIMVHVINGEYSASATTSASTRGKYSDLIAAAIIISHPSVLPRTELVGDAIRYVKAGSKVILRCLVRGALEPPSYISWFYGVQQIYQDNKRGLKLQMEREFLDPEMGNHTTVGSLIINAARKRDSGNYTCSPSNSEAITIMVHVINGEYSASAITSASTRGKYSDLIAAAIIISVAMLKT